MIFLEYAKVESEFFLSLINSKKQEDLEYISWLMEKTKISQRIDNASFSSAKKILGKENYIKYISEPKMIPVLKALDKYLIPPQGYNKNDFKADSIKNSFYTALVKDIHEYHVFSEKAKSKINWEFKSLDELGIPVKNFQNVKKAFSEVLKIEKLSASEGELNYLIAIRPAELLKNYKRYERFLTEVIQDKNYPDSDKDKSFLKRETLKIRRKEFITNNSEVLKIRGNNGLSLS